MNENTKRTNEELENALRIVRDAIEAEDDRLARIAKSEGNDAVNLEGLTSLGYTATVKVPAKKVAEIMRDYDYAIYRILGMGSSYGMWEDLARLAGLKEVGYVDM